jgi:hypothetical protein
VILASCAANDAEGDGDIRLPVISPDGTPVAFVSEATNLAPAGVPGVYAKDLATGAVQLACMHRPPSWMYAERRCQSSARQDDPPAMGT